ALRQMLKVDASASGHDSTGPMGVAAQ
ncbi:MAG: hypothetical protein JWM16_2365, partial [Verrucomicrobiales bacterium]|nr:hypothetical protein [Verrucomicrobiales bacterium]